MGQQVTRDEFARLVGEVCICWADLEQSVGFITKINLPSGPPINHLVLISEMDMRARLAAGRNLAMLWGPKELSKDIDACLNQIDGKLRSARNRYVHDQTSFWFDDVLQSQIKARIVRPQARQAEVSPMTTRRIKGEEMEAFTLAVKATDQFVLTYIARAQHLRGEHIDVDPDTHQVQHVIDATDEVYQASLQAYQQAVSHYLALHAESH